MKNKMTKCGILNMVVVVSAAVLLMPGSLQAAEDGYALLIQVSPPGAGTVNPGEGVHRSPMGESVSLSASPKPGYRFLYWLGDVASVGSANSRITVDSPKMIVAVFSREDHDEELPGLTGLAGSQAASSGGYNAAPNPIRTPGAVSPGVKYGDIIYNVIEPNEEPTTEDDDIPVPGENPIPEPATVLLMGLGGMALLKRKK